MKINDKAGAKPAFLCEVNELSKSLYIHIPFCNRICTYCDFTKVLIDNQPVDEYLDMLLKEMDTVKTKTFKTIFVGGGTPTALSEEQLVKLLRAINQRFDVTDEFTFEANPDELTPNKIDIMINHGVNRLSLGVQSFNDAILNVLGRTHTKDHVESLVAYLQSINFDNYSIDLMYNLPGETMADIETSLEYIHRLKPKHISWYSLIVEPHTVFYNMARKGTLNIKDSIAEGEIYQRVISGLKELNYKQYEISNFSKEGYESLHNKTYWENEEYYGLGAGSHGYVEGKRYSNIKPVNHYIESMKQKRSALKEEHTVTEVEQIEEEMFLGLRLNQGVNLVHFEKKFNQSLFDVYNNEINRLIKSGWVEIDNGYLRLTDQGRMVGNEVLSSFIK